MFPTILCLFVLGGEPQKDGEVLKTLQEVNKKLDQIQDNFNSVKKDITKLQQEVDLLKKEARTQAPASYVKIKNASDKVVAVKINGKPIALKGADFQFFAVNAGNFTYQLGDKTPVVRKIAEGEIYDLVVGKDEEDLPLPKQDPPLPKLGQPDPPLPKPAFAGNARLRIFNHHTADHPVKINDTWIDVRSGQAIFVNVTPGEYSCQWQGHEPYYGQIEPGQIVELGIRSRSQPVYWFQPVYFRGCYGR